MRRETEFVFCDFEGQVHENKPDPYCYGPQFPNEEHEPEDAWPKGMWQLGKDGLVHYHCPGPHFKLWIGAEIR